MTNMVTDRGEGLSALVTRQLTVDPRRRTDPLGRMAHSTVVCQANALVRRSVGRYIIHLRAVSCQGRTTVASAGWVYCGSADRFFSELCEKMPVWCSVRDTALQFKKVSADAGA